MRRVSIVTGVIQTRNGNPNLNTKSSVDTPSWNVRTLLHALTTEERAYLVYWEQAYPGLTVDAVKFPKRTNPAGCNTVGQQIISGLVKLQLQSSSRDLGLYWTICTKRRLSTVHNISRNLTIIATQDPTSQAQ